MAQRTPSVYDSIFDDIIDNPSALLKMKSIEEHYLDILANEIVSVISRPAYVCLICRDKGRINGRRFHTIDGLHRHVRQCSSSTCMESKPA